MIAEVNVRSQTSTIVVLGGETDTQLVEKVGVASLPFEIVSRRRNNVRVFHFGTLFPTLGKVLDHVHGLPATHAPPMNHQLVFD